SFIVNWTCFAARILRSALGVDRWRVNSRRKSVSRSATPRALASTADGKKIHSARLSGGRKLIPGSRRQSQVRPATAVTPKIAANDIKTTLTISWRKEAGAALYLSVRYGSKPCRHLRGQNRFPCSRRMGSTDQICCRCSPKPPRREVD